MWSKLTHFCLRLSVHCEEEWTTIYYYVDQKTYIYIRNTIFDMKSLEFHDWGDNNLLLNIRLSYFVRKVYALKYKMHKII